MKKNVLIPIVVLAAVILGSLGFSNSNGTNGKFLPVEKGKSYKMFTGDRGMEMKVVEEPKGNWVKVDITKRDVRWGDGSKYINLNQVVLLKEIEGE